MSCAQIVFLIIMVLLLTVVVVILVAALIYVIVLLSRKQGIIVYSESFYNIDTASMCPQNICNPSGCYNGNCSSYILSALKRSEVSVIVGSTVRTKLVTTEVYASHWIYSVKGGSARNRISFTHSSTLLMCENRYRYNACESSFGDS